MKDGLINIALCAPELVLGDPSENARACIEMVKEASAHAAVAVFPELSLIGKTYGDLSANREVLSACERALDLILNETAELDITVILGMPISRLGRLYDTTLVVHGGEILAAVPRGECGDSRQYASHDGDVEEITLLGRSVSLGRDIIFSPSAHPDFKFAIVVGDELTSPTASLRYLSLSGASVIINPTAIRETVGAGKRFYDGVAYLSRENLAAVISVSAGKGESTTDGI